MEAGDSVEDAGGYKGSMVSSGGSYSYRLKRTVLTFMLRPPLTVGRGGAEGLGWD